MGLSGKRLVKTTYDESMQYDFKRDLAWLFFRPWVWIPRTIEIICKFLLIIIRLIFQGSSKKEETQKKIAKNIFETITELGPCFIKIGQALSTRPDLIKRNWLEELTNLQDNLPPFNHEIALETINQELGHSAEDLFDEFPSKPIASASLGQVYKARLQGNYWVAVKVQRPDLIFIIRRDLVIIKILCILIGPILPLNLGFGIGDIVDEFGKNLFEEIDYKKEAINADKFSSFFQDNPTVTIPRVEYMLSSRKILTTSWIEGTKLKYREDLLEKNLDPTSIIRTGVISGIRQLLEFGFFHADPHPGNMFALEGKTGDSGHLAYVDFGMMDTISDQDRITLTQAIVHLINKDFYGVALAFQKLGFLNKNQDLTPLIPALEEVLGGALGENVASFNFKEITNKFSELMYEYPFRVPARFALIIRAVISQEGLALRLDPDFKIINLAYPYVAKRLLTSDKDELLEILLQVIFDKKGNIQINRIENLLEVLIKDSKSPSNELFPVAGAGIKLLLSAKGKSIRRNLLLSLIKDEKLNTRDLKDLIKVISNRFNPINNNESFLDKIKPIFA